MTWKLLLAFASALTLAGCVAVPALIGPTSSGAGTGQSDLTSTLSEKAASTAVDKGTSAAFDAATGEPEEAGQNAACAQVSAQPIRETSIREAFEVLSAAKLRKAESETTDAYDARLAKTMEELRTSLEAKQGNPYVVFRSRIPDSGIAYDAGAETLSILASKPSGLNDLSRQPLAAGSADAAMADYWNLRPTETAATGATAGGRDIYDVAFDRGVEAVRPWPVANFHASVKAPQDEAQASRGHLYTVFFGSVVPPYYAEADDPGDAAIHRKIVTVKVECALVVNETNQRVVLSIQ